MQCVLASGVWAERVGERLGERVSGCEGCAGLAATSTWAIRPIRVGLPGVLALTLRAGGSQDSKLTDEYMDVRHVRMADGPDAVHLREVGKLELRRTPSALAVTISGVNSNVAKYGKFEATAVPAAAAPRSRL